MDYIRESLRIGLEIIEFLEKEPPGCVFIKTRNGWLVMDPFHSSGEQSGLYSAITNLKLKRKDPQFKTRE